LPAKALTEAHAATRLWVQPASSRIALPGMLKPRRTSAHAAMRLGIAPNWMFCESKHYRPSAIIGAPESAICTRGRGLTDLIARAVQVELDGSRGGAAVQIIHQQDLRFAAPSADTPILGIDAQHPDRKRR
jgi:hypothetical protein